MTATETSVMYTRDEIVSEVDRGAREALGISGRALARLYRLRQIDDPGELADLLVLLDLLPASDSLFEPIG